MKRIQIIFMVLIITAMLLDGCGSGPQGVPATIAVPTTKTVSTAPVLTPTQTLKPTDTLTPTPLATQTMTATPEPIRHTPPTLMLHRNNSTFDAVQFLKDFIILLKQDEMKVITYRDITYNPNITATEQGKLFIITIDDIYLRYPIDPSVLEMIAVLRQAGYPAVLAVVTEGYYVDPETVRTLKELSDAGWEIASHTDRHSNLGEMERTAPRYVFTEVQTSLDKIEKAIGVLPHTLILPEGQMVNDPRFIKRAGIIWIVGINGGITYDSRKEIVYIGREGPDGTATQTFRIMLKRFNP